MKYKVTITEIHEVIVEAQDSDEVSRCIEEGDFDATSGCYMTDQIIHTKVYEGNRSADYVVEDEG